MGAELLLHFAYVVRFAATVPRSVLWLRAMLIAAALTFVIYGVVAGLLALIIWNSIIAFLYAVQVAKDLWEQSNITITAADEHFRQMLFPTLSVNDFHQLWSLGEEGTMTGHPLTSQGAVAGSVWLILDGTVEVRRDGRVLNHLGVGSLVGETSYLSGAPEAVDTLPINTVLLRRWPAGSLQMLNQVNPAASRALSEAVSKGLGRKLDWTLRFSVLG